MYVCVCVCVCMYVCMCVCMYVCMCIYVCVYVRMYDGSLTTDMDETVTLMLEHFTPEDNALDDSEFHKQIRALSQGAVNTPDDREFTLAEIRTWLKA